MIKKAKDFPIEIYRDIVSSRGLTNDPIYEPGGAKSHSFCGNGPCDCPDNNDYTKGDSNKLTFVINNETFIMIPYHGYDTRDGIGVISEYNLTTIKNISLLEGPSAAVMKKTDMSKPAYILIEVDDSEDYYYEF